VKSIDFGSCSHPSLSPSEKNVYNFRCVGQNKLIEKNFFSSMYIFE
jgi:hypothetical protein